MMSILMFVWALLGTVLLGVVALPWFVVAEIWQRVVYRRPWFVNPSPIARLFRGPQQKARVNYPTNSLGFRDQEFDYATEADTVRILVLGDSFTDGSGVEAGETHPRVMEQILNQRAPAGKRFRVVNAAWGGSLTAQWVDTLRHVLSEVRPHLVLAVFYMRDGTFTGSQPAFFQRIRDDFRRSCGLGYRLCYLYRRSVDAMHLSVLSKRIASDFHDHYFGTEEETVEWRMARENIEQMAALSADSGAGFALANFPTLFHLQTDHPFKQIYDAIGQFAKRQSIPYVDLFPAFEGRSAPELWVSPTNQHPNAQGHQIAGSYLADAIAGLPMDGNAQRPGPEQR